MKIILVNSDVMSDNRQPAWQPAITNFERSQMCPAEQVRARERAIVLRARKLDQLARATVCKLMYLGSEK